MCLAAAVVEHGPMVRVDATPLWSAPTNVDDATLTSVAAAANDAQCEVTFLVAAARFFCDVALSDVDVTALNDCMMRALHGLPTHNDAVRCVLDEHIDRFAARTLAAPLHDVCHLLYGVTCMFEWSYGRQRYRCCFFFFCLFVCLFTFSRTVLFYAMALHSLRCVCASLNSSSM